MDQRFQPTQQSFAPSQGASSGGGFDWQSTMNTANLLMQLFGAGYSIKQQSDARGAAKDAQSRETLSALVSGRRPGRVGIPEMDYITPILGAGQSMANWGNNRANILRTRDSDKREEKKESREDSYANARERELLARAQYYDRGDGKRTQEQLSEEEVKRLAAIETLYALNRANSPGDATADLNIHGDGVNIPDAFLTRDYDLPPDTRVLKGNSDFSGKYGKYKTKR